eukprot:scaffold5469_cov54-Attheya_sp.AAC.1
MTTYRSLALGVLLSTVLLGESAGFVPHSGPSSTSLKRDGATQMNAVVPPTMIIGPFIKKMRDEKEAKNQPLATEDEMKTEAPGLKIGSAVWKWPPVWPYDPELFKRKEEVVEAPANPMAGLMGGMTPALPETPTEEKEPLDALTYWGEEKADELTNLDPKAAEKLRGHYSFYIRDGMSILEFGAAEESYLPEGVKLDRHVAIGASKSLMDKNPSITEPLVVDLNNVIEERGIDSDDIRQLGSNTFDVIIMANTIDFLTSPREVFRTSWELMKPGGLMIVSFSNKDAYSSKFERAQTKMWTDFNDDQHMWVCGSFFQFSAGDGWGSLKGFDISPEGAAQADDTNPLANFMNKGKPGNMYVVQGTKTAQEESIDESNPEKSFKSKMWMLPTMEERDKSLTAPRLARAYQVAKSQEEKAAIVENVATLPRVYESLIKMDQFAFTFNMQAQLAADLASDADYKSNDDQILALKMGLGLRTPSKEFWQPIGEKTAAMDPEDKVNLLAYLVPRFGSGDPEQDVALESFVSGLDPTFEVIRATVPDLSEGDVQLVGTELLAAEVAKPGRSSKAEFAAFVGALSESELRAILTKRKSFKEYSVSQMEKMKNERDAKAKRIADDTTAIRAQVEKARETRTMIFNQQTGKMEEYTVKKK